MTVKFVFFQNNKSLFVVKSKNKNFDLVSLLKSVRCSANRIAQIQLIFPMHEEELFLDSMQLTYQIHETRLFLIILIRFKILDFWFRSVKILRTLSSYSSHQKQ